MKPLLQGDMNECGLTCLRMIAAHFGKHIDALEARVLTNYAGQALSMSELAESATRFGLDSRGIRADLEELRQLRLPCVLHWGFNHFVVLIRVGSKQFTILDPAQGRREVSRQAMSDGFTGLAMEVWPNAVFRRRKPRRQLSVGSLLHGIEGGKAALAKFLVIGAAIEIFTIVGPLLNQIVIDNVLSTGDLDLLTVASLGLLFLVLLQTSLTMLRTWFSVTFSHGIQQQWVSGFVGKLTAMPLSFFERHQVGDILSRVASVNAIQRTLTFSVTGAALDVLVAFLLLGVLLAYSPVLCGVVGGAGVLYALTRLLTSRAFVQASSERVALAAEESSFLMETLRCISTIRMFGLESRRKAHWQSHFSAVQNRDLSTSKISMLSGAANSLIFGLENIFVLWFGAKMILGPEGGSVFTIGMLFAFLSYKNQFKNRMTAVVDAVAEWGVTRFHAERLEEIVLAEPPKASLALGAIPDGYCVELKDVSYRHGPSSPWVLRHVNLKINEGDHIAFCGPSGSGKTTLLKMILGIVTPTSGEILIGGVPLADIGEDRCRRLIAAVLQDDSLLRGSIEDNICMFASPPDRQKLESVASMACVHAEVLKMTHGYMSRVEASGSGLSGGQRQRVLLARALYKEPKILVLDEATSHLDIHMEREVVKSLAKLALTRIVVAHRPQTVAGADRVISVFNGRVSELNKPPTPSPTDHESTSGAVFVGA